VYLQARRVRRQSGAGNAARGTKEQLTIKVPLGTQIKRGTEDIFLPALRGNLVAVTHVSDNGEKVARSIEVLKKP